MTGLFGLLFVSTGNVCRSPIAERMVRAGLDDGLGPAAAAFRISSAGTWGHDGAPMEPFAAQVLAELGCPTDGFVARELTPGHVLGADLILTAGREHREQVRVLDPFAMSRTFTLREFARLVATLGGLVPADAEPAARARALVEAAELTRTVTPPVPATEDEVADPIGAPLHVYRLCAENLAAPLAEVLTAFVPARGRRVG